MLSENPEIFFENSLHPADNLPSQPFNYSGGPLRYSTSSTEWNRFVRAMLPFAEKLAISHGRLLDRAGPPLEQLETHSELRTLEAEDLTASTFAGRPDAFAGFSVVAGLGPNEGPVPEANLPNFHWGQAPATQLSVHSDNAREARLTIEALTYADEQKLTVEVSGRTVHEHTFERINQRERIACRIRLNPGANDVTLRTPSFIQTEIDPRRLAVIYLSLRIT
jgi:hypothetical protein